MEELATNKGLHISRTHRQPAEPVHSPLEPISLRTCKEEKEEENTE